MKWNYYLVLQLWHQLTSEEVEEALLWATVVELAEQWYLLQVGPCCLQEQEAANSP